MLKNIYKKLVPLKIRLDVYYLLFKIRYLFYIGSEFECNCCGKKIRKFLDYGIVKRHNAACPYCYSLERNRLLWLFLNNNNLLNKETKLLHFAPERIIEQKIKKLKLKSYISADIDPQLADVVVDITNINFPDNSFNLIICSHVLAHIKDEAKAIQELYRVLSTGGIALIMTRIDLSLNATYEETDVDTSNKRLKYYKQEDVFRIHAKDFNKRLEQSGFNVEVLDYASELGTKISNYYSLGKNEWIYKCSKL
ncbi:MAG: hypothetical protein A2X12_12165 [Bacteroidetes bacterium GWE2_29_8]|nr:MAG: hypothetical protein A2X12_12165 [Bacteroidetes bacterium GWE2_29_8]OFY24589.1 MAG: hypothetical protein A2X02_03230 [Bacteroidetes bacterium GWF2_29_10]